VTPRVPRLHPIELIPKSHLLSAGAGTAPIGMVHEARLGLPRTERHAERTEGEIRILGFPHGPAHATPRAQIEHARQVEPPPFALGPPGYFLRVC
jgi:hypothetical protein